ncbi:hypothetical protein BDL97_11G083400 [Sphagnum fallax]|nr:hypothetical protein BDL97_11G083400 [Sphagnum fallax]
MIFGHLVWDLIQVLRGRAPNDVICHRPWPSKNRLHGSKGVSLLCYAE